ncbi:maleylpyruvate isomerase N-terminal domain-containing protein [Streptomyces sp. NPDC048639]|uniref:maleylpyruvate isomerase N-terminal domain-containing protein n=1 Tax=Streptomyces sp. NPDC048639 TaxID=3365581 RepID=UPI0037106083
MLDCAITISLPSGHGCRTARRDVREEGRRRGRDAALGRGPHRARRLTGLLDGLTDAGFRAPSALPGSSRAHVLSHIEGVCAALARQAAYAAKGELIEMHDHGRPGRDAAIKTGSRRTAEEPRSALLTSLAESEASGPRSGPATGHARSAIATAM